MSLFFQSGSLVGDAQYGYVRDVYAFGILAESLMEYLQELGNIDMLFILYMVDMLFILFMVVPHKWTNIW